MPSTMSMKSKLILALSVIMLVAVAIISMANYMVSRTAVREELLTSSLPLTRDNIYSELHKALMEPISLSSLMARDTFLKDWTLDGEKDESKIRKYLAEVRDRYGYLTAFFVSDRTGHYYHPGGLLKTISNMDLHDVWYYEFVSRGVEYDLDVDTSEAEGHALTLFINYKVRGYGGELLGVAGVGLRMDWVANIVASFEEKYGRKVFLVDPFGVIQVHRDRSLVEHANIKEMDGIRDVAPDILRLREQSDSFQFRHSDGREVLLSARYIPEFDWLVLVEQDEAEALAPARKNVVMTICLGLLAWLVIIFVSAAAVNHFQGRLENMAATDPLTGAFNRREFDVCFDRAVARESRLGHGFSLLLLDLDDFKKINDTQGHLAGDRALIRTVDCIRKTMRPEESLARWGGDEFIVLVNGGLEDAAVLGRRILETLSKSADMGASCGVAEYRKGESLDSLTSRADDAVYRAKAAGGGVVDKAGESAQDDAAS
ncbi:sensor domain-containing diguanylate cyclase [Desulfocurvus sp. DL9XJH121]